VPVEPERGVQQDETRPAADLRHREIGAESAALGDDVN
jgi:hypothetical protein